MTKADHIINNIEKVIVGKTEEIRLVLTAVLADGHVLIEDVPGTGKTMLAKALAQSIDLTYRRVQFTPDLLPSDITGINYYNQKSGEFVLRKGPAFCNILLADEINRATPRTQSALLECMAEKQISIDGDTLSLESPFFVIATQNPVETAGTYHLPEAQLDRFIIKISMGRMSEEEERMMLERFLVDTPLESIRPVCNRDDLLQMKDECRKVFIHPMLRDYIVRICQSTREISGIMCGVSPRATLALCAASRAYAYVSGRTYVTPEDIKALAVPVLAHRLIISRGMSKTEDAEEILRECVSAIPVPTEDWSN